MRDHEQQRRQIASRLGEPERLSFPSGWTMMNCCVDYFFPRLHSGRTMPRCERCNSKLEELAYNCNHCGGRFCSDHRLPERHSCTGETAIKNVSRESENYETVDVSSTKMPGKRKDAISHSTPDVNPDGTLDYGQEGPVDEEEPEEYQNDGGRNKRVLLLIAAVVLLGLLGVLGSQDLIPL